MTHPQQPPRTNHTPYTQDAHQLIKQWVESGEAVLIDVREPDEWEASHLRLAVLVPLSLLVNEATRASTLDRIPQDKPVYCHCYRGVRAMLCAELLNPMGFEIRPMGDDYEALVEGVFDQAK